jgi:hypothetical protein
MRRSTLAFAPISAVWKKRRNRFENCYGQIWTRQFVQHIAPSGLTCGAAAHRRAGQNRRKCRYSSPAQTSAHGCQR